MRRRTASPHADSQPWPGLAEPVVDPKDARCPAIDVPTTRPLARRDASRSPRRAVTTVFNPSRSEGDRRCDRFADGIGPCPVRLCRSTTGADNGGYPVMRRKLERRNVVRDVEPAQTKRPVAAGLDTEVFVLPYVFRPKQVRGALAAMLGAAALTFAVVPAADAACTATPTTKAFAGVRRQSRLQPGARWRLRVGYARGWSLTGASVVNGNESAKVHGAADAKSLAINATGKAVSPSFCVGIEHPTFRLFARRTSGTWGVLNVKLRCEGCQRRRQRDGRRLRHCRRHGVASRRRRSR